MEDRELKAIREEMTAYYGRWDKSEIMTPFLDDLLAVVQASHRAGRQHKHMACMLYELSYQLMTKAAHNMDDTLAFCRYAARSAERSRRIVSEHWPPPDITKFPYTDQL